VSVLLIPVLLGAAFFGALAAGAGSEPGLPFRLQWWGVAVTSGAVFSLAFLGAPLAIAAMRKARRFGRGDLAILYLIVALFALAELPAAIYYIANFGLGPRD
jgi:hypothetical protein